MNFLKELGEILASVPWLGIVRTVFSGAVGLLPPVGFICQVALQIYCANLLGLGAGGTIAVASLLIIGHLFVGLLIALMPLSGMSPKPLYKTGADFLKAALALGVVYGGIGTAVVLGIASHWAAGGFWAVLAQSALGAAVIHMFAVALPVYRVEKRHEREVAELKS